VVFHIDRADELILNITLGNIVNLFKEIDNANAFILANFEGPKLFLKNAINSLVYEKMKNIRRDGFKIFICENSLKMLNVSKDDLIDESQFVRAGIKTLIELQAEGFAYIKP
jgi:intracellular sulfur oxidation DsrE/DsrF family protein